MTTYQAKVQNINNPIIAQISSSKYNFNLKVKTAYISKSNSFSLGHSVLLLDEDDEIIDSGKPTVYNISKDFINKLSEDDIIQIMPDGTISVLWEKKLNPFDVTLFITHQCNANCVMCPQPPKKDEYSLLETNLILLRYLAKQPIRKIGITGGEPTLKRDDLVLLLQESYKIFPYAKIDLLTNAKKLSDFSFSKELAISNPNINFCISFPTDNLNDFNQIMKGKLFTDVLTAIQNLGILRQNVELRVVILKQNYKRLLSLSEFIYRNFPFVYHITFMGMEVVGYAFDNIELINIEPQEYNQTLLEAVRFLNQRDMHISIYNIPFCLVDEKLWRFVKNSISKWKQAYKPECNLCSMKKTCSGLFTTTKIQNFKFSPILK